MSVSTESTTKCSREKVGLIAVWVLVAGSIAVGLVLTCGIAVFGNLWVGIGLTALMWYTGLRLVFYTVRLLKHPS